MNTRVCVPRVHIYVCSDVHTCVPIGHVFQENTRLFSDEHTGVSSGCTFM